MQEKKALSSRGRWRLRGFLARRRPGLGPDGAAGRQPRGPEQRLRVGLRLVQRLRARRGSRAGQGAAASQQAALPRAAAFRAQVSAAAAAGSIPRPPGADPGGVSPRGGYLGCLGVGLSMGGSAPGVRALSTGGWGVSFSGTGSSALLLWGTETGAASSSPAEAESPNPLAPTGRAPTTSHAPFSWH